MGITREQFAAATLVKGIRNWIQKKKLKEKEMAIAQTNSNLNLGFDGIKEGLIPTLVGEDKIHDP